MVDDDKTLLRLLCTELEECGFKTYPVNNGNEALKISGKNKYLCALVDIKMPGISGYELLESLPTLFNTPTIIISGLEDVSLLRIFTCGASLFFPKPVNYERLSEVLTYNFNNLLPQSCRRQYIRLPVNDEYQVVFDSSNLEGLLCDMSLTGFKIEVDTVFPDIGTVLNFRLKIPQGDLSGSATIVWEKFEEKSYLGLQLTKKARESFLRIPFFCQIFCITSNSLSDYDIITQNLKK